jgi:hypothetical protein
MGEPLVKCNYDVIAGHYLRAVGIPSYGCRSCSVSGSGAASYKMRSSVGASSRLDPRSGLGGDRSRYYLPISDNKRIGREFVVEHCGDAHPRRGDSSVQAEDGRRFVIRQRTNLSLRLAGCFD